MTATYLGGGSIADVIPGLADVLVLAGEGLRDARTAVDGAIGQLGVISSALSGAAGQIEGAKDGLVNSALAPITAQITSAQNYLSSLGAIGDPSAYLLGVLAGIDQARALIAALSGSAYLSQLTNGVNAAIDGLEAQGASVVGDLDSLTDVTSQLGPVLGAISQLSTELTAANAATLGAMAAYTAMASAILNSGVHSFWYTGALDQLGTELDAATPQSGVSGSELIAGPILFAKTTDAATVATLQGIFGA